MMVETRDRNHRSDEVVVILEVKNFDKTNFQPSALGLGA